MSEKSTSNLRRGEPESYVADRETAEAEAYVEDVERENNSEKSAEVYRVFLELFAQAKRVSGMSRDAGESIATSETDEENEFVLRVYPVSINMHGYVVDGKPYVRIYKHATVNSGAKRTLALEFLSRTVEGSIKGRVRTEEGMVDEGVVYLDMAQVEEAVASVLEQTKELLDKKEAEIMLGQAPRLGQDVSIDLQHILNR